MKPKPILFLFIFLVILICFTILLLFFFQYGGRASFVKANIVIDLERSVGPVPNKWKALAQGGEEKGTRMLENVVSHIAALYPQYIRIDHIYDYYDVVQRNPSGNLTFNWTKLDETVCDIYHTGAKPFFVLGYMPPSLSGDDSLVSVPKNWDEWALTVQNTIEHYSGQNTRLCGQITGSWLADLYYEVWNEPDLETFGAWSHSPGGKSYFTLYEYASRGATKAQNVMPFLLGGPATTSLYRNWIYYFLDYVSRNNLKLDFLSWHHYSKNTNDYEEQVIQLNSWLSDERFEKFRSLPRVISEWGFDSDPNEIADTNVGAAHTIAAIRNFFRQDIEAAFLFEIKDGLTPSWGILSHGGEEKPRYKALRLLNLLEGTELFVDGEGTYVSALASTQNNVVRAILVNYDGKNTNNELVPVTFLNLAPGTYSMTTEYLDGKTLPVKNISIQGGRLQRQVLMPPNMVVGIELKKE